MDRSQQQGSSGAQRRPSQIASSSSAPYAVDARRTRPTGRGGGLPPLFPGAPSADIRLPLPGSRSTPVNSTGVPAGAPPYDGAASGSYLGPTPPLYPILPSTPDYADGIFPCGQLLEGASQPGRSGQSAAWDLNLLASTALNDAPTSLLPESCPLGDSAPASGARTQSGAQGGAPFPLTQRRAPRPGEGSSGMRRLGLVTPTLQERPAAVSTAQGPTPGRFPASSGSVGESSVAQPREGLPTSHASGYSRGSFEQLTPSSMSAVHSSAASLPPRRVIEKTRSVGPDAGSTTARLPAASVAEVPATAASGVAPVFASPPPVVPVQEPVGGSSPVPVSSAAPTSSWEGLMPSPPAPRPVRSRSRKRGGGTAAQRAASASGAGTSASAASLPASPAPRDGNPAQMDAPLSSHGVPLTDEAVKMITASVSKGLRDGLRGMQTELNGLRTKVDAMGATLNILCTTVNTQGVGSERTAQALQQLHGTVQGGFSSMIARGEAPPKKKDMTGRASPAGTGAAVASVAAAGDDWTTLPLAAKQEMAARNLKTLSAVRNLCRKTLVEAMLTTNVSAEAFLDAPMVKEHVHAAVRAVLGVQEEAVQGYLDSSLPFPVRQTSGQPIKARVSGKLGLVMPHLLQGIRRLVMPVYFNTLNLPIQRVTNDLCRLWLENDKYTHSDVGTEGVIAAVSALCRRWSAKTRVVDRPAVGDHPHVVTTVGVYALVSLLVRNHLEDVVTVKKETSRTEDDKKPAMYEQWRQELVRVSSFMPWDDKVHRGLRLIDGANRRRAATRPSDNSEEDPVEQGEGSDLMPLAGGDIVMGGTLSD